MNEIGQALMETFGSNPINWIKWIIVFAVLIITYVVLIKSKVKQKVEYYLGKDYKKDKAREKGHVFKGELVSEKATFHRGDIDDPKDHDYWINRATYVYDDKTGKQRSYKAKIYQQHAPTIITLYYVDDPRKPFTMEEKPLRNRNPILTIFYIIYTFLPWLLAALMVKILGIV